MDRNIHREQIIAIFFEFNLGDQLLFMICKAVKPSSLR